MIHNEFRESIARRTQALDADGDTSEVDRLSCMAEAGLHRIEGSETREWGGIPAPRDRDAAHDVVRLVPHPVTELFVDAHILRCDVLAVEGVDEPAHRTCL